MYYRSWGTFTSVTIAISAMSILTSITGWSYSCLAQLLSQTAPRHGKLIQSLHAASFGVGLTYGGPAVCVWGWICASIFYVCIGLGMAELASAYPTSGESTSLQQPNIIRLPLAGRFICSLGPPTAAGGMYYWQYVLAGPKWGPLACWITGKSCSANSCRLRVLRHALKQLQQR